MKIVRAVFSQKFALEAISAVFRANMNSAAFAVSINNIIQNEVKQSNANAAFAVVFAVAFVLSIKGPLALLCYNVHISDLRDPICATLNMSKPSQPAQLENFSNVSYFEPR